MLDKDLFKLLGKNKKYIFFVVGLMIIGLFANLSFTFSICYALEIIIDKKELVTLINPLVIAMIAIIIRYITSRITGEIKDKLGRNVKKQLREKIYDKVLTLGPKFSDDVSIAGLTQVSMEGIEQLDLYYSNYLPQFFYAMIAPFILFFVTVFLSWQPAVSLICLVPMIPISIVAVSKYAKIIFAKYWGKYTSMGDAFLDATQGLKDLKIFKADKKRQEIMNESAEEFRKITMKVLVMQLASSTIMDTVAYGGAGLGIALTILGLINNWINPIGNMVSVAPIALFIILVSVDFFLPMRQFGSAFHVGMNGASAGKKILSLLNLEEPIWNDGIVENTDIVFEHVTFSYDGKKDILKDISLSFDKGMNAIVGKSGCGKSTIINLLFGQNRIQKGQILIGNKPLESLSRASYYSHVATCSNNTYIFNETVFDNFKLAKLNVTEEEIYSALKKVNLDTFIKNNGGINKTIFEDAENISGGQKQRLALAINLIADKDIYIFDEATSHIDIESEKIIMQNIQELSKTKTVIVISHRLENIVKADKIYFIEDGKIEETGSHEMLMKKNGHYANLYNTQKELENGYKEVMPNEK